MGLQLLYSEMLAALFFYVLESLVSERLHHNSTIVYTNIERQLLVDVKLLDLGLSSC